MQADDRVARTPAVGLNYPVIAGATFIVVSLGLYWLQFPERRDVFVVVYVLTCVLGLLLGNQMGSKAKVRPRAVSNISLGWLWLGCLLLSLTATVNISVYYNSLGELRQFVLEPGAAYERVKFLDRTNQVDAGVFGGAIGPILSTLAFTKYVVFGWTALYWARLSALLRLACVMSMAYYALQAVLIGAMVNVATVLLSTSAILLARTRAPLPVKRARFRRFELAMSVLGMVVLSFFLGSRDTKAGTFFDRVSAGADGLVFYVSHGYVGLGYALEQPFVPTWGQTTFYGLTRVFTGGGVPPDSYPARTEAATGWSATQLWSTAAPWLASDFTFWAVPLVLMALGAWAGHLWLECCRTLDPFALLLLGQITVGVFFFPANNHLFQTFSNATGFSLIAIAYLLSRRRAIRRRRDADQAVPRQRLRGVPARS